MAAALQPGMSRGRRNRRRAMSEINVTPFVDVMLVLLIVFMVTAPLLTVGVPVDLPKTRAPALGQDREPLSITIKRDGTIFLQKEPIPENQLVDRLTAQKGIKITYQKIDGANHFFDKREADVVETVKDYVSNMMSKPREGR